MALWRETRDGQGGRPREEEAREETFNVDADIERTTTAVELAISRSKEIRTSGSRSLPRDSSPGAEILHLAGLASLRSHRK